MTSRLAWLLARDLAWVVLGLLLTLVAGWPVVATPGEILQGDLGYPFANEFWTRRFTSAWDTSYGTGLVNVMRTYTYVPWGLLIQAFDLTTEAAGKFHWLSWHLLGFLAGYLGARLLAGPDIRDTHPVAVRLGLMLAGLFWALNPWTLARWEQLGVHVSAVLLPLVLGLVVAATRARNARSRAHRALAAAAVLAFAVSTSPHYMAIGLLVGLGWLAYAAVTARGSRRPIVAAAVVFLAGSAIFAAFILVPLLVTAAAGSPTGPRYAEGTDVQPVLQSGQSVINTLTLTGHTFFGPGLRPEPTAVPGWRLAALVPVAVLAIVFWRQPRQRRVLGYAAIVGGATAFIQIASWHDALRPELPRRRRQCAIWLGAQRAGQALRRACPGLPARTRPRSGDIRSPRSAPSTGCRNHPNCRPWDRAGSLHGARHPSHALGRSVAEPRARAVPGIVSHRAGGDRPTQRRRGIAHAVGRVAAARSRVVGPTPCVARRRDPFRHHALCRGQLAGR